jgi:hypothetical protein
LNLCASRHELPLLKELISHYGWTEVYLKDKKADLMWLYFLNKTENLDKIMN